jgi:hypothetical protein
MLICIFQLFQNKISNEFPLYLTSGLSYNHFSNGAIETPNLGLNQFSFNIGLKYLYSKFPYNLPKRTVPYVYNKIPEFSVYLASGIKENSTYENKKFTFFSLVADYGYRVSTIRTLGLGINIISDFSLKSQIAEQNLVPNKIDILRIGIHGFQELYFTPDLSMLLQVGTYAFNKFKPSDKTFLVYSKLGLRYTFLERYFVNIVLKTHTTTADYIEFGVVLKLSRINNYLISQSKT